MLFVRLLIAHCMGDFFLQPGSWVQAREKKDGALQRYIFTWGHTSCCCGY